MGEYKEQLSQIEEWLATEPTEEEGVPIQFGQQMYRYHGGEVTLEDGGNIYAWGDHARHWRAAAEEYGVSGTRRRAASAATER